MNSIALHPDGNCSQRGKPPAAGLLPYLGYKVVLEPDYTLRSFFRMLTRFPVLSQLNPFGASFLAHCQKCPQQDCRIDVIDHLELSRMVEMVGYPGTPNMQIYVCLEGRLGDEVCDIKAYWLEQLLDMPLKLGCLKHRVFGDKMDTFDFETGFNLFEVIDGICWQLSFHNLPEQCRIAF
jgi:hypothetical protein